MKEKLQEFIKDVVELVREPKTTFKYFVDWLWRALNVNLSIAWIVNGLLAEYYYSGARPFVKTLLINFPIFLTLYIFVGIYRQKKESESESTLIQKNIDA
jgi:hypothetical protein